MDGIGFKNMKVFKDHHWFDFKKITLLTGTNNSGKSSIINAMQMLQENLQRVNLDIPIDKIARTEFRLVTNQDKYGSVSNFVNKNTSDNIFDKIFDNYNDLKKDKASFEFSLKKKKIKYNFVIEITEGIESVGRLKSIEAQDIKTKQNIFSLEIINREKNLHFEYSINYKYFVDEFHQKCTNTIKFNKEREELEDLKNRVNKGTASASEFEKLADAISNKFSVYISYGESFEVDNPNNTSLSYSVFDEDIDGGEKIFDEIGIIFLRERKSKSGLRKVPSNEDFDSIFLNFYTSGIFRFESLFNGDIIQKNEFESLICDYYQENKDGAYFKLSNDLLTILSNTTWDISEDSPEEIFSNKTSLIKDCILSHSDFGFSSSFLEYQRKNKKGESITFNVVNNPLLNARIKIKNENPAIRKLSENDFFTRIHSKLKELFISYFENQATEKKRFTIQQFDFSNIIDVDVYDFIVNEIINKVVELNVVLNNDYVSSNRYEAKRLYNFNEKLDFTSLLRKIEFLEGKPKNNCLNFINKWIKEFEIADALILEPDKDTGQFKAYLANKNNLILLADYGLGTNQLLPVIFSLAIHHYEYSGALETEVIANRTVIIEEPESNLHPAMQSKLADLFVDAMNNFKLQIIIETHSEYLIRKLQYLVAKKESSIESDDVLIYYFNKPNHPEVLNKNLSQVIKIEIDKNGILSKEFGTGFFDEADNIALELFLLGKSQKN